MDYEKKYKKALERAREELGSGCFDRGTVEYIFPELQESEDELTRKDLLEYVKHYVCDRDVCKEEKDKWIAWLEKQGNPADNVEPKFKVGDWITIKE